MGEEIARGAYGIVHRAADLHLRRDVALKTLRHRDDDPAAVERFEREARIAARLDHPGIVRVFGAGVDDGRPWIAFELVEGPPLRGPRPVDEARRILARVAEAVAHAHARGVVHRDLKPANILLGADGPVVADFGIARAPDEPRLTETGELLGTPAYMAPEQLRGEAGRVGPPADVWALGVILFELVTGRLPHDGGSFMELSARVLNDPAPEAPGLDPALRVLLARCLAKFPEERPSAAELARALAARPAGRRPWVLLALPLLLAFAAGVLRASPPAATPPDGMVRVGRLWVDVDEHPPRTGGYSYVDALQHCLRRGKRLPTEEEWLEAARSGLLRDAEGRQSEWTSTPGADHDGRVARGGHWMGPRGIDARHEWPLARRHPTLGFRCVQTLR